ncbi:hypothetical protein VTJ04DRAFT_5323 [Mycothermus thermophilus]|uniref:uncharacterized protein n=1 Tax=Humicola insolens TaxID=85995 RepID=UPI0037425C63
MIDEAVEAGYMDSHDSVSNSLPQGLPIGLGHVGGVGATSFFESNNGEIATSFDSNAAASMLASPGPVPACDARSVSPDALSISDTQGSDQDTHSSSPNTGQFVGYKCDYPGCTRKKPFRLPSQLRKHKNNHTRPWKCQYCGDKYRGGAERKDLARHLRKYHRDIPEVQNDKRVWMEEMSCPGCHRQMRGDNLRKRHMETCAALKKAAATGGGGVDAATAFQDALTGHRRASY